MSRATLSSAVKSEPHRDSLPQPRERRSRPTTRRTASPCSPDRTPRRRVAATIVRIVAGQQRDRKERPLAASAPGSTPSPPKTTSAPLNAFERCRAPRAPAAPGERSHPHPFDRRVADLHIGQPPSAPRSRRPSRRRGRSCGGSRCTSAPPCSSSRAPLPSRRGRTPPCRAPRRGPGWSS